MEQLMKPDEVAALLNVSKDWLYDEVERHDMPVLRLGRNLRFRPSEIEAWLDECRSKGSVGRGRSRLRLVDEEVVHEV